MSHETSTPARVRWARLRFAIIGPLLSAPAEAGDVRRTRAVRPPPSGGGLRDRRAKRRRGAAPQGRPARRLRAARRRRSASGQRARSR